jgi:hypothetical protein
MTYNKYFYCFFCIAVLFLLAAPSVQAASLGSVVLNDSGIPRERAYANLERADLSPVVAGEISEHIDYYQDAQASIATQEAKMSTLSLNPDDSMKESAGSSIFFGEGTSQGEIPEGSIIQYSGDEVTRVFNEEGTEISYMVDSEAESVQTPDGSIVPATHVITVPSGSSIYSVGNNDYITYKGEVIGTLTNTDESVSSSLEDSMYPSGTSPSWVMWAETDDISDIGIFNSSWIVPSSPDFSDDSHCNIIFNGLQPSDGNGIIQPVIGYNFNGHDSQNIEWRHNWTGSAWANIRDTDNYVKSEGIYLEEGDTVVGTMFPSLLNNTWTTILLDQDTSGLTFNVTSFSITFDPDSVRAVNTYEAYNRYLILNGYYTYWPMARLPYDNTMKPSDIFFTSNEILDLNYSQLSVNWNENYKPMGHPNLTGLDVEIDQSSATTPITLHTNSASKPSYRIEATDSTGGIIQPNGTMVLPYDFSGTIEYEISANSGYIISDLIVDGSSVGAADEYTFSNDHANHTISAVFVPEIVSLVQAGTPFDSTVYPQNTAQSDPMYFQCNWSGDGSVYISGNSTSITGVWADDGFTITIQPSGDTFDATPHYACQHNTLELTSGMTPGINNFTLIVKNWCRLSMNYGSFTGIGTDQTPYIIQVNSAKVVEEAASLSSVPIPSYIVQDGDQFIVNGTVATDNSTAENQSVSDDTFTNETSSLDSNISEDNETGSSEIPVNETGNQDSNISEDNETGSSEIPVNETGNQDSNISEDNETGSSETPVNKTSSQDSNISEISETAPMEAPVNETVTATVETTGSVTNLSDQNE